ncbi:integrase core domain-containing protein [Myxococcota bacterium]
MPHLRVVRRPNSPRGQSWKTFLCNHTVWACDFLQLCDIWFRLLFALFFGDINSREVIHVATTRAPTEQWTAQQLRNITPFGHGPEVIIRDRDQKCGTLFDRVAEGAGIEVFVTAPRTPTMNATCERFLGRARRECLDPIIILGERHLQHVLKKYCLPYSNTCRPHPGIRQQIPVPTSRAVCDDTAKVVAIPILKGLHHDYQVAA